MPHTPNTSGHTQLTTPQPYLTYLPSSLPTTLKPSTHTSPLNSSQHTHCTIPNSLTHTHTSVSPLSPHPLPPHSLPLLSPCRGNGLGCLSGVSFSPVRSHHNDTTPTLSSSPSSSSTPLSSSPHNPCEALQHPNKPPHTRTDGTYLPPLFRALLDHGRNLTLVCQDFFNSSLSLEVLDSPNLPSPRPAHMTEHTYLPTTSPQSTSQWITEGMGGVGDEGGAAHGRSSTVRGQKGTYVRSIFLHCPYRSVCEAKRLASKQHECRDVVKRGVKREGEEVGIIQEGMCGRTSSMTPSPPNILINSSFTDSPNSSSLLDSVSVASSTPSSLSLLPQTVRCSFGVLQVDLTGFSPQVQSQIVAGKVPFGRILQDNHIHRTVHVHQLWHVHIPPDFFFAAGWDHHQPSSNSPHHSHPWHPNVLVKPILSVCQYHNASSQHHPLDTPNNTTVPGIAFIRTPSSPTTTTTTAATGLHTNLSAKDRDCVADGPLLCHIDGHSIIPSQRCSCQNRRANSAAAPVTTASATTASASTASATTASATTASASTASATTAPSATAPSSTKPTSSPWDPCSFLCTAGRTIKMTINNSQCVTVLEILNPAAFPSSTLSTISIPQLTNIQSPEPACQGPPPVTPTSTTGLAQDTSELALYEDNGECNVCMHDDVKTTVAQEKKKTRRSGHAVSLCEGRRRLSLYEGLMGG
eukprot:GHVQ01042693.1.p1 GENE.GHVQ01042693.1~~GHVQ01042693.1.p1  ORF type:complete len:694 (-),score=154.44 GHVQ01042693.1:646-2727(-)